MPDKSFPRRLFGTDGVRGIANTELSPQLVLSLGAAAALVLRPNDNQAAAHVVVGRDPRVSGDLLEGALVAGLCALGVHVTSLGVVPTPGVAFVARAQSAHAGVVISASHNPVRDNGIKFFGPDGAKLPDEIEARIEAAMADWEDQPRPSGAAVGRLLRTVEPVEDYASHLRACCPGRLEGMRLVVDCANGAVSDLAPRVLSELGATVIAISAAPDGININERCGSLHPEAMMARVVVEQADAGIAFDGDADRVILADEKGRLFDGDRILCAGAIHLARQKKLANNVVVGTVMSNLGLEQALERHAIRLVRAPVGDRYVTSEMARTGATLGGEKSGHVLFREHTTTGDGLLTALQMLRIVRESGRPLSAWSDEMVELPQLLENVYVRERDGWERVSEIAQAVREAEKQLSGHGRLLVRPSGTEKMIRVMAEGPDPAEVRAVVALVANAVRQTLGT